MTEQPVPVVEVAAALGLTTPQHIALVGGGGKSTLLRSLGRQLAGRTVLTSTTKMGVDQADDLRLLVDPTDEEVTASLASQAGPLMIWRRVDGSKAFGVHPDDCDRWFGMADNLVVEADGARRRPFKAPRPLEPVVPSTVTTMVSVIGADALGRVIADQCHRPLRVAALAGCSPYVRLSPEAAATVILHERGARRALPTQARLTVAITKVAPRSVDAAMALRRALLAAEPELTVALIEFDPGLAGGDRDR